MAETKIVNKIRKSAAVKKKLSDEILKEIYNVKAERGLKSFDDLLNEIDEIWKDYEYFYLEGTNYIFYPELALLMSNDKQQKVDIYELVYKNNKSVVNSVVIDQKWHMSLLTKDEVKKVYFEYNKKNKSFNYSQLLCKNNKSDENLGIIIRNGDFIYLDKNNMPRSLMKDYGLNVFNRSISVHVPKGYRFDISKNTKLQIILNIGGVPDNLKSKSLYKNLQELVKQKYISVTKEGLKITKEGIAAVESGKCTQIGKILITKEDIKKSEIQRDNKKIDISKSDSDEKAEALSYYSQCDQIRANINQYDLAWLEDPNQGHWELWEGNEGDDLLELSPGNKIYARNPKCDIKSDCIVGIDFGTKSTVVVFQNESGIIRPMPIGNGDIRKELDSSDFENPTVMQFINFKNFIQNYLAIEGRPYTRWQDLIVSHAANESMKDTGVRSAEFYTYLYDLKQWAGEGKRTINLRDKKGNDLVLSAYNEIDKTDNKQIDPIEIYAYYIGLYINNMNNGIYLDYLLSFPVTYEKSTREAIIKSFERGLRKSLPQSIIDDDEVMSRFNVKAGASEPAAYAICALEEYGFNPNDNEKVFYGIFDFGGGTADFDFGLWTKSKDEELYDYRIEHFGTQGDRYLGGENLLQLIAFEAFSENVALCRKEKIPFAKPIEMINVPTELKGFVNDSQEARMNQKLMMEKIRPFWERSNESGEEVVDINEFSEFQIGLFNVDGTLKSNLAFEVDIEKFNQIIRDRIKKGVKQFFEALKDTFTSKYVQKTGNAQKINIFLAGNSSKSPILKDIFQKNIDEWNKGINRNNQNCNNGSHFELFPPLGTEEAKKIQQERGVDDYIRLESPTGKSGVAWGLIEGREGGRIEVIEEVSFESETKFAYYLGIQKGKNFCMKIHRYETYFKWIRFLPAKRKINEILFTSLPEATSGKLASRENGVFRKRISIPEESDDDFIYIRLVSVNDIEFAIGDMNGNIDESSISRITL